MFTNNVYKRVLLPTAKAFVTDNNGLPFEFRFILDSGSEVNFISYEAFNKLQLPVFKESIQIKGVNDISTNVSEFTYGIITSKFSNFRRKIKFNLIKNIINIKGNSDYVANKLFDDIPEDLKYNLADGDFQNSDRAIDGLLGVEIFFEVFIGNHNKSNFPFLHKTLLRWVAAGNLNSNLVIGKQNDVFLTLDSKGVAPSKGQQKTHESLICEDIFKNTLQKDGGGKFIVPLPRLHQPEVIGNTLEGVKKRFWNLEKRFGKNCNLKFEYSKFINELVGV